MKIRLQKHIADAGIASRRASEKLILEGRVLVNNECVRILGTKIDPDFDIVKVDEDTIKPRKKRYVAVNKPRGFVCTRSDEHGRRIITELLPAAWTGLNSVGRLDRDSEGLIFLTNDGDFALKITHPSFGMKKKYLVTIEGRADMRAMRSLTKGIKVEDELLKADDVRVLSSNNSHSLVEMTLSEGKNREIRRMFRAIGSRVDQLKRTQIGQIKLGELPVGKWRTLSTSEIQALTGSRNSRP